MHSRFLGFFSLAVVFVAHANGDSSWEVLFKAALKPQRARETLRHLTRRPHMAGTPEDHANALWMEAQFLEFGIPSVEIEESWPLLNKPLSRSLTLLSPFLYAAPLVEDIIPEDPDSRRQNAVPSFFGYGSSGNVSAALVYANFGTVQDFDALKERGIDVRGKIVLVRYGSVFRGLKVRAAELAGAAGVLVYSDPKEDGINRGPVYPGAFVSIEMLRV